MKKKLLALTSALLMLALLCGCGATMKADSAESVTMNTSAAYEMAPMEEYVVEEAAESDIYDEAGTGDAVTQGSSSQTDLSEKIIYTLDADIETLDFDTSLDTVSQLLEQFGGFVENSSVSGVNYSSQFNGRTTYRYATYTLRIPVGNFQGMTDALEAIGNVTQRSIYSDNITTQYYDSQSRLNTYRTEEERLLSMLEKVEDVESMIAIEERLSDVRYNIESIQTRLTNWQNQVDYSTVNLYISEVAQLTEEKPVVRSYWQQVGDDLSDTLKGIGRFFKNLLRFLIAALPVLALLAVAAVVVVVMVKKLIKKRKAKKQAKAEDKEE